MNMTDKARTILTTMLALGPIGKHLTMTSSGYVDGSKTDTTFASCSLPAGLADIVEGEILREGYIKAAPGTYIPKRHLCLSASVVTMARDGDVINVTAVVCGGAASVKVAA